MLPSLALKQFIWLVLKETLKGGLGAGWVMVKDCEAVHP